MKEITIVLCVLISAFALAHFDHDDPRPHALQSDFTELRTEVTASRHKVNDSVLILDRQLEDINTTVASLIEKNDKLVTEIDRLNEKCCPDPNEALWVQAVVGGASGALFGASAIVLFRRRLLGLQETSSPKRTRLANEPADSEQTDGLDEDDEKVDSPAVRTVTASRKDENGIITAICNHEESWRERFVEQAISDMKRGIEYESLGPRSGARARIDFVESKGRKPYLKTVADDADDNNLDSLPDC